MKHDMNKFNLTQFECRIQNLIKLLVNQINQATASVWFFFDDVYFFLWKSIFSIYLLPADIWEESIPH